ncbi:MAG: hypothetical protein R3F43_00185 [bacterium]
MEGRVAGAAVVRYGLALCSPAGACRDFGGGDAAVDGVLGTVDASLVEPGPGPWC